MFEKNCVRSKEKKLMRIKKMSTLKKIYPHIKKNADFKQMFTKKLLTHSQNSLYIKN